MKSSNHLYYRDSFIVRNFEKEPLFFCTLNTARMEWDMEEKIGNKVGYYSIIPSKILYNKELKANEKLLYAMITSLACKEGYCFATNNYFAEELGVHPKTISSWISDLREKNYLKVDIVRNENKQIIQRKIYINDVPYPLNNGYQYQSKNGQAINQKMEGNNIKYNNKYNKVQKKYISSYENQREYNEKFLESLYANFD